MIALKQIKATFVATSQKVSFSELTNKKTITISGKNINSKRVRIKK